MSNEILNKERKINFFSITNFSVLLIFLSGFLSPEVILCLQVITLIFILKKINLPLSFVFALVILMVQSLVTILLGTDSFGLFIKQYIGIVFSCIYWLAVIRYDNIFNIIYIYICWCKIVATVAIFQYIMSILGFESLSNIGWLIKSQINTSGGRSAAFFSEPSECALILFPVIFLILYKFFGKYKKEIKDLVSIKASIVILLGYLSTMSSVGFIGILISFIFILIEYKFNWRQIVVIVVAVISILILYNRVDFFQQRVNDTFGIISNTQFISKSNLSTQTLILNEEVAIKSFQKTFGLGGGLGSHEVSYNKYITDFDIEDVQLFLNKEDANSLLLRMISEIGLIGIIIIISFFVKYKIKRKKDINLSFIIFQKMILAYMMLRFIRFGHYFNCGLFLFLIMYYRLYYSEKYHH